MREKFMALNLAIAMLFVGCVGNSTPEPGEGYVEATIVSSAPEDATVRDYNSTSLDDDSKITLAMRQAIDRYEQDGIRSSTLSIGNDEWGNVKEEFLSLNTSYVSYRGYIVEIVFLEEN